MSTDRAAEHAKKQARRPITVEMKRAPFRIQNKSDQERKAPASDGSKFNNQNEL